MHQRPHEPHTPHRPVGVCAAAGAVVRRALRSTLLATGVLALVVAFVPRTGPAVSLASSTYLCTGYQGCAAAGYSDAGYRQASGSMYWRMYSGHNCTNYVAYRLIRNGMPNTRPWSGDGNASNWGVAMASITDQVPTVGAVAWYRPNVTPAGGAGHVAYVEQVISDTEIIVSEDYWGGDFYWRRVTKTGGGWPSGFIHFNDRVVKPTTPPTITGSPMVGAPLEVAGGSWTPAPAAVTYRWLADGAAIPGATGPGYVPTADVKGKTLTAEVTAQVDGYAPGEASLATAPVAPGTFAPAEVPSIQGTPEVGSTLSLTASSWTPQPARTETQWYADGKPLDGATGPTLTLTRDHVGAAISARVTASSKGYLKSRSNAAATAPVQAKQVALRTPSQVSGKAEVGGRLTVTPGTTRPTGATASYQWTRDGKRIAKADHPTYTVRKGDLGHALAVQVTLEHRNFRPSVETVAVTAVTTTPTLKVRTDATKKRVSVEVRVKAIGARKPAGAIAISVGGQDARGPGGRRHRPPGLPGPQAGRPPGRRPLRRHRRRPGGDGSRPRRRAPREIGAPFRSPPSAARRPGECAPVGERG